MARAESQIHEKKEVRLMTMGKRAWEQKDVKNEGRSDYMYENRGHGKKMSCD